MKKLIPLSCAAFLFILFSGCAKYEDGPVFSLVSKAERLEGTWKVLYCSRNDTDVTSAYSAFEETYDKHGGYSYIFATQSGAGSWQWADLKRKLIRVTDNKPGVQLVIMKLKQKELWYNYREGEMHYEFHMVPK